MVVNNIYRPSGLGFVAEKKRTIKPAFRYDKYFTRCDDPKDTLIGYMDVFGVLREIEKIVAANASTVAALCDAEFKKSGRVDYKAIWQWLYDHIQYKEDEPGNEQLRSPWRLFKDKCGDCDCYTIFISCCLTYFKVPHYLRVIERHHAGAFHHIYVIVPKPNQVKGSRSSYTVIDPVMDKFDAEPDSITTKYDYPMMKVTYLNGLGNDMPVENTETLHAIKAEMEAFRNQLIGNPGTLKNYDQDFLISALGHVLDNFDDAAARDAAFQRVIALEAQNGLGGLNGVLKNARDDIKKALDKAGDALKQAGGYVADKVGDGLDAGKIGLLAPVRLAFLGLLRLNVVGMSSQFRIGMMSESEATSKGIPRNEWALRVSRLNSALSTWEKTFGGKQSEFKDQINQGAKNKPLFAHKVPGINGLGDLLSDFRPEDYGFYDYNVAPMSGLGEPLTVAASIALAAPIIAKIVPLIKDLKEIKETLLPNKSNTKTPETPNPHGDQPQGDYPLPETPKDPDPDKSEIPWTGIAIGSGIILTGLAAWYYSSQSPQPKKSLSGLGNPDPEARNKRIKITI